RRHFREFRPDVIIHFGSMNSSFGIRLSHRYRLPFVEYVIDELYRLMRRRVLQGVSKVVEQADYRRAGLVLSINEALRDYSIAMGTPRARTAVLRAGVDLDLYLTAGRSDARRRLGLRDDDLIL